MPFSVNGTPFLIAPYNLQYIDILTGYDHNGRPIIGAKKNIELTFDKMSVSMYNQFSALHGTSLTSISVLTLDGAPTSYITYSNTGINFQIKDRPKSEAGYVTGFTVLVTGVAV